MLLNLLKDADFNKGVCQSPLIFITQKGRVGLTVKDSETYKQCVSDRDLKKKFGSETTSKFSNSNPSILYALSPYLPSAVIFLR